MSDSEEMPGKEFQRILKVFKQKGVKGDCPACGADIDQRGTLSNYSSLHFTSSRQEDTDDSAASFVTTICRKCGHVWLFHADTLMG